MADFMIARPLWMALSVWSLNWTDNPSPFDARHLLTFLGEQATQAEHGCITCHCPALLRLHGRITALPWWCL